MQISVFCGNCDHGPVMLGCLEDGEKTRCTSCGVYMHDAILEEDFDEDYCHGCESGVDFPEAHSKKCQEMSETNASVQEMSETNASVQEMSETNASVQEMSVSVFCGNCEKGPIILSCLEDNKQTKCVYCGVYMDECILEEDFYDGYCIGCESGVDCSYAHTLLCQDRNSRYYKNF